MCRSPPPCAAAGEYLPLVAPVITEGRPEEWLNRVEAAMFATTKRALARALEESKGAACRAGGVPGMLHGRMAAPQSGMGSFPRVLCRNAGSRR